jgi:hypothetical protein
MNDLRSTIAAKVLNNIRPHVKPIDYLMETLSISRESVYRRIRGDISFTFEEIAILSVDLGFSIDELIMKDKPSHVFFDLHTSNAHNFSDVFIIMMQQYFQSIFEPTYAKHKESFTVLNHVPFELTIFFNNLFKFIYYRWMHQGQTSLKYLYSDVNLPKELINLQQNVVEQLPKIHNCTFIFDSKIILNLIHEIQYFYRRKLINPDEIAILKNELLELTNMMENIAQAGINNSESKCDFYLSILNIESNSRYFVYDDRAKSQFLINAFDPITITNPFLCALHKKWIDSLRKYTTLITQTNEILLIKYLNEQRAHIDKIVEIPTILSL